MNESELLEYWYSALRSAHGIKVQTNNITQVRAKLYAVRRAANDERLAELSLITSPDFPNEIWITRTKAPKDLTEALKDV